MNWKKILVICLSLLIVPTAALATSGLLVDLESYYKLEETGFNYVDATTNFNISAGTAPTQTTGVILFGQDFDGTYSYISRDASFLPFGNAERTFSFWVKLDTHTSDQFFASYGTSATGEFFGPRVVPPNQGGYISFMGHGADLNTNVPMTTGVWMHLCYTYDGSVLKIYKNAVEIGSGALTLTTTNLNDFTIGARDLTGSPSKFVDGKMDEFGIWSTALNSTQVTELYNSGAGLTYPFTTNTNPTITNITNQVMLEDVPTTFNSLFTINDTDGNITDLTLTYTSSNTSIIAAVGGVTFATSDTTGITNVTITPEGDAYGILTLNITVTDLLSGTALDSFQLTVTNVNDRPTISAMNNVTTLAGATVINPFTVLDIDNPYTDLTYSASSDNAPLFTSTTFSNSNSTNQNLTMVLATYGQAIVNVTVSDLEPLSDSTTFSVFAYCNTSIAPYTDTNAVDAPPSCYDVSGSFDEDTDIFTYTWFDLGNTTENNFIEIYRTTAGSYELVAELDSTNNSGSFEVNLSAYPKDDFAIRGYMTDTSRTFIDGESTQRVYILNVNQQLNLAEAWFTDGNPSDGIIWSLLIVLLFLTIGIASQSATMTLILSIFGLFFATQTVFYVPSQFLWTAGVVVAILIGIIAKLRID